MSDEQALYITLLVLYLLECTAWVPRGCAALISKNPLKGKIRFPRRGISNNRGGLVLGSILPGSGAAFVVSQWPLSLSPEGILSWVAESLELDERAHQSGVFVPLGAAGEKAKKKNIHVDGREIRIDSELVLTAVTPEFARRAAVLLGKYLEAPPKKKEAILIEYLTNFTDIEAAKRRVSEFYEKTQTLRFWSFWVAITAFIFAPGLSILYGFINIWPILLGLLYLPGWVAAFFFYRAQKALFPRATKLERIGQTALIALLPINAMRATDPLARSALCDFHPLTVAAFLSGEEQRKEFAAHLIRDLNEPRRPVCISEDKAAVRTEKSFRGLYRKALAELSGRLGLSEAAALAAPEPEEAIQSYCPRCLAQFGGGVEQCGDCGGIPVRAFSPGDAEHAQRDRESQS